MDSPIASQCVTTRTTGGGDVSIGDLLNEVRCILYSSLYSIILEPCFIRCVLPFTYL